MLYEFTHWPVINVRNIGASDALELLREYPEGTVNLFEDFPGTWERRRHDVTAEFRVMLQMEGEPVPHCRHGRRP
jgi:hypothetical protein